MFTRCNDVINLLVIIVIYYYHRKNKQQCDGTDNDRTSYCSCLTEQKKHRMATPLFSCFFAFSLLTRRGTAHSSSSSPFSCCCASICCCSSAVRSSNCRRSRCLASISRTAANANGLSFGQRRFLHDEAHLGVRGGGGLCCVSHLLPLFQ